MTTTLAPQDLRAGGASADPSQAHPSDGGLARIVEATAAALATAPEQAQVVFGAEAHAHGTVASTVRLGRFAVEVDEPAGLGGAGGAPNPVEYYLAALLSCQIVTYRFYADRLGLQVDRIAAAAEGDLDVRGFFALDPAVRAGFSQVRVRVTITGPEEPTRYRHLQEVVDAHCPVLDLTANPTPVVTTLEVEPGI